MTQLFGAMTLPPEEALGFVSNVLESSTEYSIIGLDLEGKILLWNSGATRIYGYEPQEVIGTSPRRDSSGEPIGYLLMSKDISVDIRLTEELKATQSYTRSLIEASLDPLVTISPEGKITDVNEATIKVTGVGREGLIGADFSDYFTEPDQAREGYQRVFAEGSVTEYPLTIRHRDGALTDVLYNASVYKDAEGNVLGVFAAARDVTAQKQAEAEVAKQRAKELERLAELERFQRLTVAIVPTRPGRAFTHDHQIAPSRTNALPI